MFKRSCTIREVDNGFIVNMDLPRNKPEEKVDYPLTVTETTRGPYICKELICPNIPKLLKLLKTFFEPTLTEEGE